MTGCKMFQWSKLNLYITLHTTHCTCCHAACIMYGLAPTFSSLNLHIRYPMLAGCLGKLKHFYWSILCQWVFQIRISTILQMTMTPNRAASCITQLEDWHSRESWVWILIILRSCPDWKLLVKYLERTECEFFLFNSNSFIRERGGWVSGDILHILLLTVNTSLTWRMVGEDRVTRLKSSQIVFTRLQTKN